MRKNIKNNIIIAIILTICFSFSLTSKICATSVNIDGVDPDWAVGHVWTSEIEKLDIHSARISLYDIQAKQILDTKTIISSAESTHDKYGTFGNLNKTIIINSNKMLPYLIEDSINNGSSDDGIIFSKDINLPQLIINKGQSSSDFINNVKTYFENENNVIQIMELFNITPEEKEQWKNKQISMLVEPVTILYSKTTGFLFWQTTYYNLFTCAEIGILAYTDTMVFKAKDYADASKNYDENCYKALPFSCYKAKQDYIRTISPYNSENSDNYCNTQSEWLDMVNSLGCFELISNGTDTVVPEEPKTYDVEYYTNSWVITPCNISSSKGFPRQSYTPGTNKDVEAKEGCLNNKLAVITYEFESDITLDKSIYTQELAIPPGETAVSWAKWKCPSSPCEVKITIRTNNDDAVPEYQTITAKIIDPISQYPPNNEATDRNDNFIAPNEANGSWNKGINKTATWTTYNYYWNSLWVWGCSRTMQNGNLTEYGFYEYWDRYYVCDAHHCPANAQNHTCPTGRCHSVKEDWGWVVYEPVEHKLTLDTYNEKLYRSSETPNTNNSDTSIKSGYGIEYTVDTTCIYKENGTTKRLSEAKNAITPPQYLEVFLPEHEYKTYEIAAFNDIERDYIEDNNFTFPECPYSQFNQKCHFTPIWYPDGKYVVGTKISQCFCPGGMLSISNKNVSININGNVYDDWHIAPKKN